MWTLFMGVVSQTTKLLLQEVKIKLLYTEVKIKLLFTEDIFL